MIGTVSKVGNGRAVFIPAGIDDDAFAIGSKVSIEYEGEGVIVLRGEKAANQGLEALARLEDLVSSQEVVPWEDDSREADRALLGDRYA